MILHGVICWYICASPSNVVCKQTEDKHIFHECALKIALPAARSIFQPRMHYILFGGRALPGPAGGVYSSPPDSLAGFKWPTLRGDEGRGGRSGDGRGIRVIGLYGDGRH